MTMVIKTDHKWKQFSYRNEVPEKVLKEQFSHLDEEESHDCFLKYKGYWYHVSDFMRLSNTPFDATQWDGYHSVSYFSGQFIKLSEDGETYKIARYMS
jgi:hypothetical protein